MPYILLAVMSVVTLGGPLGFGFVLRGGERPNWPPDRAVEWVTLLGLSTAVVVIMAWCLALAVANIRESRRILAERESGKGS